MVEQQEAQTPSMPSGIFISYRRQETAYAAGWLYQQLRDRFGSDQVFKDVDNLDPGDDFYEKIDEAVGSCAVLLALIGDQWLDVDDGSGVRRLDDPQDFVRLEIEAALRRGVRVVPLLVAGARMPRPEALPQSLSGLTRRHAVELTPERFEADTQRLLGVLERTLTTARARFEPSPVEAALPAPPVETPVPVEKPVEKPEPFAEPLVEPSVEPVAAPVAAPIAAAIEPLAPPSPVRRPAGIPPWAVLALVAAALLLTWANWPVPAGYISAWKDEDLSGWYVYRRWDDTLIWAPLIALAGAVGAGWSRALLGVPLGAAAFTVGTATMILVGDLSYEQTGAWLTTLATGLAILLLGGKLLQEGSTSHRRIPAAAAVAVALGAGLWLAADAVEHNGYSWLQITHGAGVARQIMLLVAAAPLLVDLGGRRWRTTFETAGVTSAVVGLVDVLPTLDNAGDTIIGLKFAALLAYSTGIAAAAVLHRRTEHRQPNGLLTDQ
jgi:hypothetical protein